MIFIEPTLDVILNYLKNLQQDSKAQWGKMSSQRMIEHLSDNMYMAMGKGNYNLAIPEDKIPKMQAFLNSSKPMAKNIQVYFAKEDYTLRNSSIEEAINEFTASWKDFEEHYNQFPHSTKIHPFYGHLNRDLWLLLIAKNFTHHFKQFNLLE